MKTKDKLLKLQGRIAHCEYKVLGAYKTYSQKPKTAAGVRALHRHEGWIAQANAAYDRLADAIRALPDDKETALVMKQRAEIVDMILTIENRAMACDGPVTNTRIEMTDEELQRIYVLAGGKIHA